MNRKVALLAGVSALLLSLSACVQSDREPGGGEGDGDATFTFAAAGAPAVFDPFYANDTETFRITRQLYEGLLSHVPGTTDLAPGLATEWSSSDDGLTWSFTLRKGVTFHDGTDFNADAVCANFDRWYNQKGVAQSAAVTENWGNSFGGFADSDEPSLYESCEATGGHTVDINFTRVSSLIPTIMTHSSLAMSSPTALKKYDADNVTAKGSGFEFPPYAQEHPTGTGPFKFVEYDDANGTVTLERNEDYWGEKAGVSTLIFRIIPDEGTRRQELEAGTIDGYDLPNPVDWNSLKESGHAVHIRPAFNIMYLGLNTTTNPALEDLRVRQALLHSINRERLVQTQLPEGAEVASQLMPKTAFGYNEELEPYPYDVEKAKELLADAGHADLELELWYPTEVSRPYMPDPQRIFEAVRADWEAAGITVQPVAKPWAGGYLEDRAAGKAPAYLLGGTGDSAADKFIDTFFATTDNAFATANYEWGDELAKALKDVDAEADESVRLETYRELNAKIMREYLPSLPLAHVPPAIVVGGNIEGLVASPLTAEDFSTITVTGE